MRTPPAVVILDVNETLSDMGGLEPLFERIGLRRAAVATWFASTLRDGIALTAAGGYADFAAVARATLATMLAANDGDGGDHDQAIDDVLAAIGKLHAQTDVAPGLARLHDAGVRIVALTNGSASNAVGLLERAGAADLVEQVMSVDEVGRWKPAPETYHYAVARCAVEPAEAMLVAVHPWDVDGAKRAGLRAAWINRAGLPFPRAMVTPDVVATDLVALADEITSRGLRQATVQG